MALPDAPYMADEKYTALHCLVCFLMSSGPTDAKMHWITSWKIGVGERNVASGGERIWWMVRSIKKPSTLIFYISVNPGECRLTRPRSDEGTVIPLDEVDEEDDQAHLDKICADLIDELSNNKFYSSLDANALLRKAHKLREQMQQGRNFSDKGISIMLAASREIADRQQDVPQSRFLELYHDCVLNCEVDAGHYAVAELLIRLQMQVAHWIEGQPYADPVGYFKGFLGQIDEGTRNDATVFLIEQGKSGFKQGKKELQIALDCQSLVAHQTHIVRSVFYFTTAHVVAELLAKPGTETDISAKWGYNAMLAEESIVCARAGLLSGVKFFLRHPDDFVADVAKDLSKGKQAQLSKLSTPTWPTFPTFFAKSIIASAKSLQDGPLIVEGLSELKRLQRELHMQLNSTFFERDWLTRCLLRGYLSANDEENAKRMSTHLAASATISAHLRKELPS